MNNSPINTSSESMFPAIRDGGIGAASRERFKKQISFIKIHYNYEKSSKFSEEVTQRRRIVQDLQDMDTKLKMVKDLKDNCVPNVLRGINYDKLMKMDIIALNELVQKKIIDSKMTRSAIIIQKKFRAYMFKKYCFQTKILKEKNATRL